MYLESFQGKEKVKYGVEAKLLLESDYKGRSQSTLIAEYISSKGMRKFIDRKYRKRGCMIGYIMQGNPSKILENINKKIRSTSPYKSDESEILKPQDFGLDFDHCYESEHPQDDSDEKLRLRHLLLSFS